MTERGAIHSRERARQLRDFTGLRFGNVTPTDIDGFVEFHDELFVWIEIKLKGHDVPRGQCKALERSCDAVSKAGRMAAVLIVEHDTEPTEDIDVAACSVREWRYLKKWRKPIKLTTCREAIDKLLDKAGIF